MDKLKRNLKKSNKNNSKVLDSIKKVKSPDLKTIVTDNHKQIEMERLWLNPLKDKYIINRSVVVPVVEKALLGHTSVKEPGEHKDEVVAKFYKTSNVFHTDEENKINDQLFL